jgi:hypothetical protein
MNNRPRNNYDIGDQLENFVKEWFENCGLSLKKSYPLKLGCSSKAEKITHNFDLGSEHHKVIVECKAHRWTRTGKMPSAKLSVWNEAMYYFYLAPKEYRKIFVVLNDKRTTTEETLLEYFQRNKGHFIPDDVEVYEFDLSNNTFIGNTPQFPK